MNVASIPSQRHPIEQLADDFVTRFRHGERPSLTEYVRQYPDIAEELADIIGALLALEDLGDFGQQVESFPPVPERLGEYRIVREIGRGGMGVVYAAEQEELGRHVALKVLPSVALLRPNHLERFRREARAAARLHHTNIIPIYGVGVQDGIHFYAMQYIPGRGLDTLLEDLRNQRTAPAGDTAKAVITPLSGTGSAGSIEHFRGIARLGLQVAEALAHAHEHGVLHRDIKPANILLDEAGIAWLGDFGLAYLEGDAPLTSTGGFVGTLRYLAPERFKGDGDARSDVYSLGATLYELLTLRPMFDESDRPRLISQVAHESPPRPRRIERHIPIDLETIVLKATAKEPRDRYQSALYLVEDLTRFIADRPVAARRATPVELAWRWVRRNPVVTALATAIFAALSAGLATTLWQWQVARENLAGKIQALADAKHQTQLAEQQTTVAQANRHRAHQLLADTLNTLGTMTDRQPVGEARRKIMERAVAADQALIDSVPIDPEERLDVAKLAVEVANLRMELKQYNGAFTYLTQARDLCEPEASQTDGPVEFRMVKARVLERMAQVHKNFGRDGETRACSDQCLAIRQDLFAADPTNPQIAFQLASALHGAAVVAKQSNDLNGAIQHTRTAINIMSPIADANTGSLDLRRSVVSNQTFLMSYYQQAKMLPEAHAAGKQCLAGAEKLLAAHPTNVRSQEIYADSVGSYGDLLIQIARQTQPIDAEVARDATAMFLRAEATFKRLIAQDPTQGDYHRDFSITLSRRASVATLLGRPDDAVPVLEQSIRECREALRIFPNTGNFQRLLMRFHQELGLVHCELGDLARAAELAAAIANLRAWPFPGDECLWSAELLCRCAVVGRNNQSVDAAERSALETKYLDQAMDQLRLAVRRRFQSPKRLEESELLAPLKERAEFRSIVAQVRQHANTSKAKTATPKAES